MKQKLPKKLSALIRVALVDESRAFRSKLYHIDMSNWHVPAHNELRDQCQVCLAGAVMAFSLKADINEDLAPSMYSCSRQLQALNLIRKGDVQYALRELEGRERLHRVKEFTELEWELCIEVVKYHDDRTKWRRDMKKIATRLEAARL